jgi:hypothetical protein
LLEVSGGPGREPPCHIHDREDELLYVLDGKLKVLRESRDITLCAGDSVFLPRKAPHTFRILSPFARWLVHITPGGFEWYFRELGTSAANLSSHDPGATPDAEKMARVGARYGLSFLP